MPDYLELLNRCFEDDRLMARDKAIYTFMLLRMDSTREYRFGVALIERSLAMRRHTIFPAIGRLVDLGYIVRIPAGRWVSYRLMVDLIAPPTLKPRRHSDDPRMTMPQDTANTVLFWLAMTHRQLSAAITADMPSVSPEERKRWLTQADQVADLMDTFSRWLARFAGGVEPAVASAVEETLGTSR